MRRRNDLSSGRRERVVAPCTRNPLRAPTFAVHTPQEWKESNMDKDRVKGTAEQAKGKMKEQAGKLSGDKKLETEGKVDKHRRRHEGRAARQLTSEFLNFDESAWQWRSRPSTFVCAVADADITSELTPSLNASRRFTAGTPLVEGNGTQIRRRRNVCPSAAEAIIDLDQIDVRFGSQAVIGIRQKDVRFGLQTGLQPLALQSSIMSARIEPAWKLRARL